MNDPSQNPSVPISDKRRIDELCVEFEKALQARQQPNIHDFLHRSAQTVHSQLFLALLNIELSYRTEGHPTAQEYKSRFPQYSEIIEKRFAAETTVDKSMDHSEADSPSVGNSSATASYHETPKQIGRFEIRETLGEGGFGTVYLAHDTDLERLVALKVPRENQFTSESEIERFFEEARAAAKLKHVGIVAVYDVARHDDTVFVVQEYIAGQSLSEVIRAKSLTCDESVAKIIDLADAIAYAHQQGLVHRDVKPQNVLVDEAGHVHVADFGMAVHESAQRRREGERAGTPAYMAPEQVRGETHLLDGRADIWALGVIMYRMLTKRNPFQGDNHNEVFDEILKRNPKPPRQREPSIPSELERICLKCLSKKMTDRYGTALDLADDLRHWQESQSGKQEPTVVAEADDEKPIRIVPKGLRSFDEGDADFFLELLPGPRDRDGLPESIRFWKTRMEETDTDKTFRVGLIYGPSGCGKSSLVKAGLLPRVSVTNVYVDAAPEDTETRILKGLRKQIPGLGEDLSLVEAFEFLREGAGSKVVVVLDQFEQWLHAHRQDSDSELASALRQCDGNRLQAVLMIRDDFWMGAERLSAQLDSSFQPHINARGADLFSEEHAIKVLTKFGRAYERFQDMPSEEQQKFIDRAVSELAQDGRIVSVRLSLFADMMREKKWTLESLSELGGAAAVGITFLEETFSSRTAPPKHRLHETAAREVLKTLLPEVGTDIKGHMRSHVELQTASGYENRSGDFNDLLRILDGELRLITPTDPEGAQTESGGDADTKYYQLTHDYLVPSLREWLTRKQKETWQGRAALRLEERAAQWSRSKENRFLPHPAEYITIQFGVPTKKRTQSQNAVIRAATRRYGAISFTVVLMALLVGGGTREFFGRRQAATLVDAIQTASPTELESLIRDTLPPLYRWAEPSLKATANNAGESADRRLRASLATVPYDASQVPYLMQRQLDCPIPYVGVTRSLLRPHRANLESELWTTLHNTTGAATMRFRAAMALAEYSPDSDQWTDEGHQFLATELVNANPIYWQTLLEYLEPKREGLIPPLAKIFAAPNSTDSIQKASATALAEYVDDSELLAQLSSEATGVQYNILYPVLETKAAGDESIQPLLTTWTQEQPKPDDNEETRVALGKKRAGAAISLLRLDQPDEALEVLRIQEDPESLTQFVHGCKARGIRVEQLLGLLNSATLVSERYGLLLALGEYELGAIAPEIRSTWVNYVKELYANDPRSGIHGVSGWLLRRWGLTEEAKAIEERDVPYSKDREWFTLKMNLAGPPQSEQNSYFTFVVFPAGDYEIGSPEYEADLNSTDEHRRMVTITRPFAVLDREVTRGEIEDVTGFAGFRNDRPWQADRLNANAGNDWYLAVDFCRKLSVIVGLSENEQAYGDPESLNRQEFALDPLSRFVRGAPLNWPVDLSGRGFRLPTSAEWEIACRGGSLSRYGFGCDDDHLARYGWYEDDRGHRPRELRSNMRGLFDMQGNMHEFCQDWSGGNVAEETVDPMGPPEGSFRVLRGGGWGSGTTSCRSARRFRYQPSDATNSGGLRVVLTLDVSSSQPQ